MIQLDKRLDAVFEGGGARGLALSGAVVELERRGHTLGRLVGTSAGAITATLVAAGYSGSALRDVALERLPSGASRMTTFLGEPTGFSDADLLSSTLGKILKAAELPFLPDAFERRVELVGLRTLLRTPPFANLFSFVERGGLYSADGFVTWLKERLGARGLAEATLEELHERTGRDLTLMASDTTARRLAVLNHRTAPRLPIVSAVRMSMSIPFLWPEVIWSEDWGPYQGKSIAGHAIMDGGLISNFALRFLVSEEPWVQAIMGSPPDPQCGVLGLTLDASTPVDGGTDASSAGLHTKTFERVERVFDTALEGNDMTEEGAYDDLVCSLPTGGYGTLEFDMSTERIEALMKRAAGCLDGWLARRGDSPPRITDARASMRTGRPSLGPPPP